LLPPPDATGGSRSAQTAAAGHVTSAPPGVTGQSESSPSQHPPQSLP
jgi:hypothetical protein